MPSKPLIVAALGARGTGKSAWVRQWLQQLQPARLAVWDLMQEHDWAGPPIGDLGQAIRAMLAPRFSVRFTPSRDDARRAVEFDKWCRACLAAGRLVAYVEELAFVTKPSAAPAGWRELCLLGRHQSHQVTIVGTSQRPAQVDKEFFGNVDLVHVGRLANGPDARKCADLLGVHPQQLQQLPDLEWVERAAGDTVPRFGRLEFSAAPGRRRRAPSGRAPQDGNLRPK